MFVSELGMSPKKFWKLSFYEWSLWMNRINRIREERDQDHRLSIILHRNWMALYSNSHRDPKEFPNPFEPKDFFQFPEEIASDDKENKKLSADELNEKTKDITKKRLIQRGRGNSIS